MAAPVPCAIVGAGRWGSLVASALGQVEGLALAGVADESAGAAAAAAARLGCTAYGSLEAVLADAAVEAVVAAVPNDQHASVAQAALRAGKHVFLEKPMALLVRDADATVAIARQHGRVLMVDHLQRYYAPLRAVKQLADAGVLGAVLAVSMRRRDLLHRTIPWLQQRQRVGGLLYQSACHEYDFLCWLCGEPKEIACLAAPRTIAADTLDYPDLILSQLRFASGAVAQVWNCMSDPVMGYDGVVTGSEGSAWFDLYRGRLRWQRLGGEEQEQVWDPPDAWSPWAWVNGGGIAAGEAEALRAMLANFRDAVRGSAPPAVSGADGARVVELAQAGYLSLAEQRPVALPLPEAVRGRTTFRAAAAPEMLYPEAAGS
jgi:predicted dehydrogenase